MSLVPVLEVTAEPRSARVAGAFYPDDPAVLRATIEQLLAGHDGAPASPDKPRILISPHAGYPYAGSVASRAFHEVQGRAYDGVVVVGFTHRLNFEGTSVETRDAYHTPLGPIPVDTEAVEFLQAQPGITHVEEAHEADEHSMEVMLPFLQVALGEFRVVPMLMGRHDFSDAQELAAALAQLAQHGEYLFVFSTDLSHYHPYDEAKRLDDQTVNLILRETAGAVDRLFSQGHLEACGRGPVVAGLLLAQRFGYLERRLLLYANSGDTTGEASRGVVGYAAIGMYPPKTSASVETVSRDAGMALVRAARQVITAKLQPTPSTEAVALDVFPELQQARGMFVTLRKHGELRGCIGRIETDEPMASLLPTVSVEAALADTRFLPVTAEELDDITVEVSVLSPPAPVSFQDIVAGRDGVVLRKDGRSGVFLPQVWTESGWTRLEFLRELAHQKAGLQPDAWQSAQLFTFQDQVFEEH
ncbi:MAG: hypothetical protein A3I71_00735 [Omnitrophica WOR_2 bacterium RIFCSPLOWO2_02_FULL_63_16]|nr:MAG: hypothetical protein A2105_00510 [Omnitrophica WOR_2 bacterium GWF2_63_9]OGX34739.1 MAG: hypothetical protein A3B73_00140 [Omnitrophica WOR_2 bacterium RIFCSPHIGHO2_02_FULL_63_39]OGX44288.1 MAG: hypothetical protein A3I71_00735 [Omnitrophica WOR_2 bacterium RIFCSPLOWO2_02_FULL_63_16]OGX47450.1 MAG: hypothetical protein A3G88_00225 [Omnitrophica WOR_2 bacterium RIFCSPLOWO2_12_FULL_63_16]